ncbi:MAG TPA: hypothetical protein VFV10_06755 [Gammaproteobacteria bacterium]|nr:hypothetical protein [Gammaproteobacteria bacterium]
MGGVGKSISVLAISVAAVLAYPASAQQGQQGGPAPDAKPSALRRVPAETTAAAATNPDWKAPKTSWGDPSFEGVWSSDDMRSVPLNRPQELGTRQELDEKGFEERASRDEAGRNRAVNTETFLRNEWGVRTFGYSSLVVDPANGQVPEMTAAGKARAASRDRGTFGPGPFNDFEDFTLYDRCITRGLLGSVLPVIYGNGVRIAQSPGYVALSYEMIHDTRLIPLDGRPHVSGRIRQYLGDSRGRWEGDTLVIETTNMTDQTSVGTNGNGIRHSDRIKITERLTRVDPDMIEYVATVEDPVTYTAPFTVRLMLTTQPNYEMYEYSCHEGNQAVYNALSGERAFEQQVAEAIANDEPPPQRANSRSIYRAPEEGAQIIDINAEE